VAAEVAAREVQRAAGGDARDRLPALHRPVHQIDLAARVQHDLEGVAVDLPPAGHRAPDEGGPIALDARSDGSAARGIEVGEEGRDRGGPGQESAQALVPAAGVGGSEQDAPIGADEGGPVRLPVEREAEGQLHGHRAFLGEREGRRGRVEGERQRDRVVAAGPVRKEADRPPVQVEGIARHQEIAAVGQERDAVRVRVGGGARAGGGGRGGRPGMEGEGVASAIGPRTAPGDGIVGRARGRDAEDRGHPGGSAREAWTRAHVAILRAGATPVRPRLTLSR
jgi:hypothetical protein